MVFLIPNFVYEKPVSNLESEKIYYEYVCERLFTGIFCFNKTNIFVNDNAVKYYLVINREDCLYQPTVFSCNNPKDISNMY